MWPPHIRVFLMDRVFILSMRMYLLLSYLEMVDRTL